MLPVQVASKDGISAWGNSQFSPSACQVVRAPTTAVRPRLASPTRVRVLIRRQQRRPLCHQSSDRTTQTIARQCVKNSSPTVNPTEPSRQQGRARPPKATMLVLYSLLTLLGTLSSFATATALTYKLTPNEKECFYTHVAKEGSKVAFYFAVQSGGSFDSMLHWQHAFT